MAPGVNCSNGGKKNNVGQFAQILCYSFKEDCLKYNKICNLTFTIACHSSAIVNVRLRILSVIYGSVY